MARKSITDSVYVQPGDPVSGQALYRAWKKYGLVGKPIASNQDNGDGSGFEDFRSASSTAAQLADFSNDGGGLEYNPESSIKIRPEGRTYSIVWDNMGPGKTERRTRRGGNNGRQNRMNLPPTIQVEKDSHLGVGYDGMLQATNIAHDEGRRREIMMNLWKKEKELARKEEIEKQMKSARGRVNDGTMLNESVYETMPMPMDTTMAMAMPMPAEMTMAADGMSNDLRLGPGKPHWYWKDLVRQMRWEEEEYIRGQKSMDPWGHSRFRRMMGSGGAAENANGAGKGNGDGNANGDTGRLIELMELEIQEMAGLPKREDIVAKQDEEGEGAGRNGGS
ncbi:hypothetical protein TBLA_0H02780 [Henningerozyma blattae CBS 6284]|uniref:Uncharacterized protein n=1 Tax=Henningerozyma blattae (strain ATCC 34711 / CBS 6284 / DSM 70876 / NBRC 10599 / NRRL Y-10934 / UCD 77-7) TaxID=1071380 RepID=I2H860_HENB6|nr:hypothetical protein TBLA_0H02780 [Tetrapisispora blattae CBS 6284]CCH62562.1 hypothetical protein TBLA_0H02780 [Tetrapisispora blattae CBS 6284]